MVSGREVLYFVTIETVPVPLVHCSGMVDSRQGVVTRLWVQAAAIEVQQVLTKSCCQGGDVQEGFVVGDSILPEH